MNTSLTLHELEAAMRNGKLQLFYQPKICLLRGRVIGAEALVRWTGEDDEVVSPDVFLPLVESSGLLHDLTLQLLDQLVQASVALHARDSQSRSRLVGAESAELPATHLSDSLSLSINVAPDDLASRTISNRIDELLNDGVIEAGDLQIEITESAVMGNLSRVYDDLLRLKNMGIRILMDDFGTGYSSIDRLSQLPFDAIKLDQGVVRRMGNSLQNLDVVRSTISMARELGMTSVAEGIESAAVYNFLIAHGCEEGQGYFLGRPMSLPDFQSFVAEDPEFEGSQIGRVHQACLNLVRFRKTLIDAAFCHRVGDGVALQSVVDPGLHTEVMRSRLGMWYFGIGQHLTAYETFRLIEQPLREVHTRGLEFLAQLEAGVEPRQQDKSLEDIDRLVDVLISHLNRLERALLSSA